MKFFSSLALENQFGIFLSWKLIFTALLLFVSTFKQLLICMSSLFYRLPSIGVHNHYQKIRRPWNVNHHASCIMFHGSNLNWNRCIDCFHSRGHYLCKFIGTKESVCIRKEFNSKRTGLGHKHGRRFIVFGHQYGCRDVMWKHSIGVPKQWNGGVGAPRKSGGSWTLFLCTLFFLALNLYSWWPRE